MGGRVKQGVSEYLQVGAAVRAGDLKNPAVQEFFADNIKTVSARQKRQCIGDDKSCAVAEKFSSRYEDMQLTMFLLGNAFRMDSGKPPEKVKQVKEAKAFTKEVTKLRTALKAEDKKAALLSYALRSTRLRRTSMTWSCRRRAFPTTRKIRTQLSHLSAREASVFDDGARCA